MLAVPAAATAALRRGSHRLLVKLEVLAGGVPQASTDPAVVGPRLKLEQGSWSVTRRAAVRRSLDLTVTDVEAEQLVPIISGDLLDPLAGNEVQAWRGWSWDNPDGSTGEVLLPVGRCRIGSSNVAESDAGVTVSISGADRAASVAGNPWRAVFPVAAGTSYGEAMEAVVTDRLGFPVDTNLSPSDEVLPADLVLGDDANNRNPWADVERLAASIGQEVYFDPLGALTSVPIPNPDTSPVVWSFAGDDRLRLRPLTRSIDGDTFRNGVVVRGEAPWLLFPVVGEAWDDDPTSPARRALRGEHPEEIADLYVGSADQANAAAAAKLPDVLGIEEEVTWAFVPHPGLEAGDVIELESPALGDDAVRFVVESLRGTFDPASPMQSTTRRRRR